MFLVMNTTVWKCLSKYYFIFMVWLLSWYCLSKVVSNVFIHSLPYGCQPGHKQWEDCSALANTVIHSSSSFRLVKIQLFPFSLFSYSWTLLQGLWVKEVKRQEPLPQGTATASRQLLLPLGCVCLSGLLCSAPVRCAWPLFCFNDMHLVNKENQNGL